MRKTAIVGAGMIRFGKYPDRFIEIERLRFTRREVCDRARLRLQVTLSEAQRMHLPDLSRPRGR